MLSFAIYVTGSVYGYYWTTQHRVEHQYELVSKFVSVFPTVLTIGLLQTPIVHRSAVTYMVIANARPVFCCAASMILLIVILAKYANTKPQADFSHA